ncbi:hypothetical protein CPB86DRAFT_828422 [Serendipita vermifera]|nr:hypothetical protein CPB86DRAFT_828422 [Serendipita vermifera]
MLGSSPKMRPLSEKLDESISRVFRLLETHFITVVPSHMLALVSMTSPDANECCLETFIVRNQTATLDQSVLPSYAEQNTYLSGKMIRNNTLGDSSIDYAMRRPRGAQQYAKYEDRRTPTGKKTKGFIGGAHARAGRRPKEG